MPEISVFKNVMECSGPIDCDLLTHMEDIRDGMWRDIVLECRSIRDKEKRDLFKQTMPTATLSGTFSYRNDKGLTEHSGIMAIDLDAEKNPGLLKKRNALQNDKYVYALWLSVSGDGFRVLFFIDPSRHRDAFRGISTYLADTYDLITDRNGVNVSKPYIVSYDPLLYINPEKVSDWKRYPKETVIKPIQNFVYTDSDFHEILKNVVGRNIDITNNDYNDWVRLGLCIADKFGEDGREYFRQLSQSKQTKISVDKQYDYCLKAKGNEKVNISTFYYLAKSAGVNIVSEQTKIIVRATKNGKKTGLKKDQIISNLKEFDNITGVDNVVDSVFDSTEYNDEEESILHVLELFISNNYSLRMNEVTGYIESKGKPQSESDLNTLFIAAKKVVPKLDFKLMMRLLKSDFIQSYNPFLEFLGSDGIPYILPPTPIENGTRFSSPLIDKLSATIVNDNPAYTQYFTRKWIVGIISAMHKVHSPLMHTLLGPIGTGKTEWYRRLLPNKLQPYFQQSKLDKGKDDELLMCENILILDDELSGKSKADSVKLNNITSTDFFSLRRPYGDHNEKVLRYAVLCGNSNYPKGTIPDSSLNRRIIPIDCFGINKEDYNLIDKTELFMEAFRLYKEGFDWRITVDDVAYLNIDSEKYEIVIKEQELIDKYYTPGEDYKMSTTDIAVEIEFMTRQKMNVNFIGREMIKLGFEKKSVRKGNRVTSKWLVNKTYPAERYYSRDAIEFREQQDKKEKDSEPPF